MQPLLNGASPTAHKNLPELIEWVVKNIDATSGQWPLEVVTTKADGKEVKVSLYDLSHAISELFVLGTVIAEDADISKNVGVRAITEIIQAKIAALQAGQIARANAKYLGYTGSPKPTPVKISVTPASVGINGTLEQQEMADFLKPSTQTFIGWEMSGDNIQGILFRILEGVEIARAALFQPLRKLKDGSKGLTGDDIKKEGKKQKDKKDKEWEEFKADLKKGGVTTKEYKGVKKADDAKPTDP
jgi:hypothetical protein